MAHTLPRKIKKARERKGLTQVRLAQVLGVTQPTVSRWESGRDVPSWPLRGQLAVVLELPELASQ